MNEPAFVEFLNSIPTVSPTEGGNFHDDIVGFNVERTLQTFNGFWSSYPAGFQRLSTELDTKLGVNWEECYKEYLKRRRGL